MWRACLPLFKSEPSASVHQHLWETLLALWDLGSRHKRRGRFDRKGKDAPPLSHWGPPWLGVREWAASLPQVSAPHQAGSVWPHKPGCRRIGSLVNAGKANNFNENKYNRYHMNTTQNTTELQGRSDASHHGILASFLSKVLVSEHQRHGTASFPHGRGRNQGPRTRPPLSSCPHPPARPMNDSEVTLQAAAFHMHKAVALFIQPWHATWFQILTQVRLRATIHNETISGAVP